MQYHPYEVFCASRKESTGNGNRTKSHFIVSMNDFAAEGYPVDNCGKRLRGFWKNATLENYLHVRVQYSAHPYLARKKCIPFKKLGKVCHKRDRNCTN